MSEPSPELEKGNAGVIVPPPLVYLGTLVLALGLDYAVAGPGPGLPGTARIVAGIALLLAGTAIPLSAIFRFRAAGTEVRPWMPSTALVTTGIYHYTRNPMYIGMSLIYAGIALLADSLIALAVLVPLLVAITYGVIMREERYLEVTFGEEYRRYKGRVRRWV